MSNNTQVSNPPQNLHNRDIRIIRNDAGYGFTLSRYIIFNDENSSISSAKSSSQSHDRDQSPVSKAQKTGIQKLDSSFTKRQLFSKNKVSSHFLLFI